jgi:hypothetical protein
MDVCLIVQPFSPSFGIITSRSGALALAPVIKAAVDSEWLYLPTLK